MPEQIQNRLELTLDENRTLRSQLAEVQRAFEQHVLDGKPGAVPAASIATESKPRRTAPPAAPMRLVRRVRQRLLGAGAPGPTARSASTELPARELPAEPRELERRRESARLRAEIALAQEKSNQKAARLERAEARISAMLDEIARLEEALRVESERGSGLSDALTASQRLLQQLGPMMERRLTDADSREAKLRERLRKLDDRLHESEQALGIEREARAAADRSLREAADDLAGVRDRVKHLEQALEAERRSRGELEQARAEDSAAAARLRERLDQLEQERDAERAARQAAEQARSDEAARLAQATGTLEQLERRLDSEREARSAAEAARIEEAQARARLQEGLDRLEPDLAAQREQLAAEREHRRAMEQERAEQSERLAELEASLARVREQLRSESEARRAAEDARTLDGENLVELRERYARLHDRLSERDRMIDQLGGHIEAARASAARLFDNEDFSPAILKELVDELREGAARRGSDDA